MREMHGCLQVPLGTGMTLGGVVARSVPSAPVRAEVAFGRRRDRPAQGAAGGEVVRPQQGLRIRDDEIARDVGHLEHRLDRAGGGRELDEIPAGRERLGQLRPKDPFRFAETGVDLEDLAEAGRRDEARRRSAGSSAGQRAAVGRSSSRRRARRSGRSRAGRSSAAVARVVLAVVLECPERDDRPVLRRRFEEVRGELEGGLDRNGPDCRGLELELELLLEPFAGATDFDAGRDRDGVDRRRRRAAWPGRMPGRGRAVRSDRRRSG